MFPANSQILIVDDMAAFRMSMKNQLKMLGFSQIHEACHGADAMNVLLSRTKAQNPIQLVISDWNMPGYTGIDLLKKIRATPELAEVPFIMVTAEGDHYQVREALQAGTTEYLIKPFRTETLRYKLQSAWEIKGKPTEVVPEPTFSAPFEEIIKVIIDSTKEIFAVAVRSECNAGKPEIGSKINSPVDIGAAVGLVAKNFAGALVIAFPKEVYYKAISKFLFQEVDEKMPGISDGAAEILNMILGRTKAELNNKRDLGILPAIPTVFYGKDMHFYSALSQSSAMIPFSSTDGNFYVEVSVNFDWM